MGKRKTKRKAPPKRVTQKLDKEYNCPYCSSDKSVEINLNHKAGVGSLVCRACRMSYETQITAIEQEIDVFSAWVDSIEEGGGAPVATLPAPRLPAAAPAAPRAPAPKRARMEKPAPRREEYDLEYSEEEEEEVLYSEEEAPEEEEEEEEYDFGETQAAGAAADQPRVAKLNVNAAWDESGDEGDY